ncbi:response regulator transcription factor [Streptomyces scabiei]|uniref:response regulator transcription factor n=1 Tax=Streptomyces scabiei TaxID=1930 RepID=UPI0029B2C145|nr:response regulator transcription factor [Streptomyces scabiei]MDX3517836.1 response regulator transcription factor [Streptomyces scabiei]
MVVAEEALVRSGFRLILSEAPDIDVVATAIGGEAVDTARREAPDVVLLDIRMPDVDGPAVLRRLRALPEPPVVAMLTTFDADEYILAALRSNATGILLKDTEPDQLAQVVRTLATGGVVVSPKASRPVRQSRPGAATVDDEDAVRSGLLGEREREVLQMVAEGLSDAEIGTLVPLGAGTVQNHVSAILGRPGGAGRVQGALLAQWAGLLGGGRRPAEAGR